MTSSAIPVSACNPNPVIHLFPGLRTAIRRALKTFFQVAEVARFAGSSAKAYWFCVFCQAERCWPGRGVSKVAKISACFLHNFHSDTTTNYLSTRTKKRNSHSLNSSPFTSHVRHHMGKQVPYLHLYTLPVL